MKKNLIKVLAIALSLLIGMPAMAQFSLSKAISAGKKAVQAVTLSDQQVADYVKESVAWMDANNTVAPDNDPYTVRLNKLTAGLKSADGIPLNFKVYKVSDVNAFACADGSVRVFSSLMDIMDDDELLGIIGHEIGHVAKHHSKNAMRTELLTGALKDGLSASRGRIARLTDSQLGALGESLLNAKYSQKQEKEADDYGYEFLKSHGKNPWGMVRAFEKFLQMEGNSNGVSSYINKMFSSHPETKDRIKRMTERCKKDGIAPPASDK